jgi:hypothetical protein
MHKKAEHMQVKSSNFRKVFALEETESVIQDYVCSEKGGMVRGHMYISQNFICYQGTIPAKLIVIPFRKITSIDEEKPLLSSYIVIVTTDEKYYFGSFAWSHHDECLVLLRYLLHNPPSYVKINKSIDVAFPEKKKEEKSTFGLDWETDSKSASSSFSSFSSGKFLSPIEEKIPENSNSNGAVQKVKTKVNVEATERALRDLQEVHNMGADTLRELSTQAETIDRIELGIDNIHASLDKTHKLMRGIESIPSYIGNSLSKRKDQDNKRNTTVLDRTIVVAPGKLPSLDIEILCKLPNDSLVEALLRIGDDTIRCVDPKTDKLIAPEYVYYYSEITQIIMRARPEHCDIRFQPQTRKQRFRLMSSYLQIMTNEIKLRAPNAKEIEVTFEQGVLPFEYNHISISIQPTLSRTQQSSGFFRSENQFRLSTLITTDAETKEDLHKVDRNLDQISRILGQVNSMAKATGEEINRQNEQLDRVNKKVDAGVDRMVEQNYRIDKVIHS